MQLQQRSGMSWLAKVLLLALAYVITGRLALLLAIPPGFATAIFPPVGVALAAVLIWGYPLLFGVFIGSTLLNLSISIDGLAQFDAGHLWVASGIASGTTLQCLTASWLIRRLLGFPNPLVDERSIFMLLLLGGPLSCLISAGIGPLVLFQAGLIPASALPFSFWTWWVGDSIGVFIATPLMFIAFAEPRVIWRSRVTTVGLPLLLSCALIVGVFIRASAAEQSEKRQFFQEQAKLMSQTLRFRLQLYSQAVSSIEHLHLASRQVDADDFRLFVRPVLRDYPGILALSWSAWVMDAQRAAFEREQSRQTGDDFSITVLDGDGQVVPAPRKAEYAPVTFIEPLAENRRALGFDITSEPDRLAALNRARVSDLPKLTVPINLLQGNHQEPGFLLIKAVGGSSQTNTSLKGFAVAVIRMSDVINRALGSYPRRNFHIQIEDISTLQPEVLFREAGSPVPDYAEAMIWRERFEFGDRQLRLQIAPSAYYLQQSQSFQPWLVLASGLLICSLLGGFLLTLTGRAELIRRQVRQRTLELSAILDHAAEAILIFANDGRIEIANPAAAELLGVSRAALLGLKVTEFLPGLSLAQPGALQAMFGQRCERMGRHGDGHQMEVEISLSHYELPDRQRYICLLRDISARKQIERLKSEFVSMVSHELRTPLTSIQGSLGLLEAGVAGTLPAAIQDLVQMAMQNTLRLATLVDDILDIEKLEFGQVGIQLNRCTLLPLLHEAVAYSQGYAEKYRVQLQLDTGNLSDEVVVMVDNLRLQQVVANLISNAVKYSPQGGLVRIRVNCCHDQVRVSVSDQGPGIPEEFRTRIFHKFAQADSSDSRQQGGTGLGLSICKVLLERMNGQIGYDTELGVGSTFFFDLPLPRSLEGEVQA